MINTQLHNQLIDIEIERRAVEATKRVQEAKTKVLKERLKQALYIVGFLFAVALMLVVVLRLLSHNPNICPLAVNNTEKHNYQSSKKEFGSQKKESKIKSFSPQKEKKFFSGTEYVKENNYVYKRVYKNGDLIKEERLEPTILESKKVKKENIPQFSTLKKSESVK